MASIEGRNGKFSVRWRSLSGVPKRRTCPTARAAKELKLEVETALSLGRDWEPAVTGEEPEIEDVAVAYLKERKLLGDASETRRVIGVHLELLVRFASTKRDRPTVTLLSRPFMMEFLAWLSEAETSHHKRPRAQSSLEQIVRAAERTWIWAEQSERWPGLIPRPRRVDLPSLPPTRVFAPTWAEMDACIQELAGWHHKLVTLLRYAGLRLGESMQLLWSDVDLKRGLLDIRPEIDKRRIGRTIPIAPVLIDEIATWGKREGYLIPSERRTVKQEVIRRAWEFAGVREAIWRRRPDHAFRRGFKSGLLGMGATPDAVDFLQGHSLGSGSRGRYIDGAHLPLRETVALVPKIGSVTGNVVQMAKKGSRAH